MFLSHKRFFYGVAGMEGAEWSLAFPAFLLVGIALLALILVVLSVIDTNKERRDSLKVLTVAAIWVLAVVLIAAFGLVGWSVPGG
jgi:hypothetical protein